MYFVQGWCDAFAPKRSSLAAGLMRSRKSLMYTIEWKNKAPVTGQQSSYNMNEIIQYPLSAFTVSTHKYACDLTDFYFFLYNLYNLLLIFLVVLCMFECICSGPKAQKDLFSSYCFLYACRMINTGLARSWKTWKNLGIFKQSGKVIKRQKSWKCLYVLFLRTSNPPFSSIQIFLRLIKLCKSLNLRDWFLKFPQQSL